jgi:hypothetical protein
MRRHPLLWRNCTSYWKKYQVAITRAGQSSLDNSSLEAKVGRLLMVKDTHENSSLMLVQQGEI